MRTMPAYRWNAATASAGASARPMLVVDQMRRGNTAQNANRSGPTAALVVNGIHISNCSHAGSASQKVARRMGSASVTVDVAASITDPSSAEGLNERRYATTMAKNSVTICTRRNASTPRRCPPTLGAATSRGTGTTIVSSRSCRSRSNVTGREGSKWITNRCQSGRPART